MPNENNISLIKFPELPDSVDNALQNLTDTPTKNAGQTFGDIWYLVFGGISHAADKKRMKYSHDLEIYRQELNNAIEQIPEEKRIEPSIQITAQALENSKYCVSSEELRKMFVNLISGTMNSDYEKDVHPSFPEILKQMSPKDALVLQDFRLSKAQPFVNFVINNPDHSKKTCEQYIYFRKTSSFNPPNDSTSISSLARLGLITLHSDEYLTNESVYTRFKTSLQYAAFEKIAEIHFPNGTPDIQKGMCQITPLGEKFLNVCLPVPTISLQIV